MRLFAQGFCFYKNVRCEDRDENGTIYIYVSFHVCFSVLAV